ncbi:LOW QUALITY PROTEIN: hypothetical protein TorRG33x02_234270, partial [Trema orientale]
HTQLDILTQPLNHLLSLLKNNTAQYNCPKYVAHYRKYNFLTKRS